MSNRKYASGYEKLKKKRRVEKLIESQRGALDKFLKNSSKQDANTTDNLDIQQPSLGELEDDQVGIEKEDQESSDNEHEEKIDKDTINEEAEEVNQNPNQVPYNVYDPGRWENIDIKLRDLLVEKGPIRISEIDFPKDENSRHFSSIHYTRKLLNGEKHDRKWLVYSKEFDKVYCFCCKLFNTKYITNQLGNEGTKDWKNLSSKLKNHETSNGHITNMSLWVDLELRLAMSNTTDKNVQEQISREKEH